jgi:hypothetical protein
MPAASHSISAVTAPGRRRSRGERLPDEEILGYKERQDFGAS